MARQLFLFAIFLTFSLVSPAWAERDVPVQPDRPLITFVELDKRQLLVVGSGLVKSPRDQFFFSAENAGALIALPFTVNDDGSLLIELPYKPTTGVYRLGIGVNENSLRISELVTLYDDTGCFDGDDDEDGVPNGVDAFPLDPNESEDTDHDGIGNNADLDDDNDGVPDALDAFPLDSTESSDFDADGIGDNADSDDDNDGIPDSRDGDIDNDGTPDDLEPLLTGDIDNLNLVIVEDSADPSRLARFSTSGRSSVGISLHTDGSLQIKGYNGAFEDILVGWRQNIGASLGTWYWDADTHRLELEATVPSGNGWQIQCFTDEESTDNVIANSPAPPFGENCWPVNLKFHWSLFLDPNGQETDQWTVEVDTDTAFYLATEYPSTLDYDWTIHVEDVSAPIAHRTSESIPRILFSDSMRDAFSTEELVGEWGFTFLLPDDQDCFDQSFCGRKVVLEETGLATIDGHPAQWILDNRGDLRLFYVGSESTVITVTRLNAYPDQSGDFLITTSTTSDSYSLFAGGVKVDRQSVTDLLDSGNLLDLPLISGGTITSPDTLRDADGRLLEAFGYYLSTNQEYKYFYRDIDQTQVPSPQSVVNYNGNWSISEEFNGYVTEFFIQEQFAIRINVEILNISNEAADGSYRVHIIESADAFFVQDGVFQGPIFKLFSRVNFFDATPYYDINDADRDGVPDDSDDLPLDPSESVDTDGDGFGNNADPDDDNDGVDDTQDAFPEDPSETSDIDNDGAGDNGDAFPNDPAASVDTDNDGQPDDWNEAATSEQIADSSLTIDTDDDNDGVDDAVDAFSTDAAASVDTDGDGLPDDWNVGVTQDQIDNSDLNLDSDDDNDGTADADDPYPLNGQRSKNDWEINALSFDNSPGGVEVSINQSGWTTFNHPSAVEPTAYVENSAPDQLPIAFENGGTVFFAAQIPSGEDAEVYFSFTSNDGSGDSEPYTTEHIRIQGQYQYLAFYSVDLPPLPNKVFDSVRLHIVSKDVEIVLPWVRLSSWLAKTTPELLDPNGSAITLISSDAQSGFAFSYGLCGYDYATGWAPYCGGYPEDSQVKWEPVDVNSGRIEKALRVTWQQNDEGYFYIWSGQPLDLSPYREKGVLSFDIKVPEDISTIFYNVGCTWPCGIGYPLLDLSGVVREGWTRFEVPFSYLEALGLDLSRVETALEFTVYDFGSGPKALELANVEYLLQGPIDSDEDGIQDWRDAFPDDPAASVDTDGDGMPDDWNETATAEQISSSGLTVDTDDDNDGVLDQDDDYPLDPTRFSELEIAISGIVDPVLRQCVADIAEGSRFISDVKDIGNGYSTVCPGDITSLSGLEPFTALRTVTLVAQGNSISDVTPLAGLNELRWVELEGNNISDISPLAELPNIEHLGVNYNPVTAFPDGAYVSTLRSLHLSGAQITNHAAIAKLEIIEVLNLENQASFDASVMAGLDTLQNFSARGNGIIDLAPFSNLTNAFQLGLDENLVSDLSPLTALAYRTDLGNVYLQNNRISDVGALAEFASGVFYLDGNPVNCESLTTAEQNTAITVIFNGDCIAELYKDTDGDRLIDAIDPFPEVPADPATVIINDKGGSWVVNRDDDGIMLTLPFDGLSRRTLFAEFSADPDTSFGGTVVDEETNTFTFPSSAEPWGGFANVKEFVTSLPDGGRITFKASAETPTNIRFRLEYRAFPDWEPYYNTESILIDSSSPTEYSIEIPSQGANTFSSLLLYLEERDQPVMITDVVLSSHTSPGDVVGENKASTADFSVLAYGGAVTDPDTNTYVFPENAEPWAGFANNADIYPFDFSDGGSISLLAAAEQPTNISFRFEFNPYPNSEPSYTTQQILIEGSELTRYQIEIPSQGDLTFSSLLMNLIERDSPVVIRDIVITDSSVDSGINYGYVEPYTDVALSLTAQGDLDSVNDYLELYDERTGTYLGRLFDKFSLGCTDFGPSCSDTLVVNKTIVQDSAEAGQWTVRLRIPPNNATAEIEVLSTQMIYQRAEPGDRDLDGVPDEEDAFPDDPNEAVDTDGDGVGNNADPDDDNDGILDGDDEFPNDASESVDTDGDGIGNNADTDDDGDGYLDNFELTNGTDPLDPYSFPNSPELARLVGTWKIASEPGASWGVGPAEFDTQYYNDAFDGVRDARSCFFDDEYVFGADGSFMNVQQGETFVEVWQAGVEGCSTPVAPHDGSNAATFAYDAASNSLTLTGVGAYIGIPKAINGSEIFDSGAAPESITYNAYLQGDDTLYVTIEVGDVWWNFILERKPQPSRLLVGTWKLSQQDMSLGVGPAEFDSSWWTNFAGVTELRACYFDDEYVFYDDGSFQNLQGDETWLFAWQSGDTDRCGAPVAPHDGSATATYAYDAESQMLQISGIGAYVGLPGAINGSEIYSPADAPESITYNAYLNTDNTMTVTIEAGAGVWWNFLLERVGDPPDSEVSVLQVLDAGIASEPFFLNAFDSAIGYGGCPEDPASCPSIDWDVVSDSERGYVLEVTHSADSIHAGLFLQTPDPIDLSAYANGGLLSFDIKVITGNTDGISAKIDCVYPCTSGDIPLSLDSPGQWQSFTWSVSDLVDRGLDLTRINTGLVITPAYADSANVVYRLDNVRWYFDTSSDRDGDGVIDSDDAFKDDPAASLDTDGDGMPDEWNVGATEAQIAASDLVLDSDDDNDGVPDSSDYYPKDPDAVGTPIDQALAGLVDANFRECVAYWSRNAQFAEEVTFIDCIAVESLEGLRAFSRLEQVFVDNNTRDFSELAYLPLLRVLEQDNGPSPETLEPIRGNTNLEFLQLQGVEGSELEVDVINTLTNLEQLGFNYSNIPVLPDFSALTKLKVLNIYRTNTQDIQTVALLTGLTQLGSFDNPLADIQAISELLLLTKLSVTGAGLTDISPISGLLELTDLQLGGNDLRSLEPLADLTKLTKLWLDRNLSLDVSFLPNADQLTDLRLDYTGITDLSVLSQVPNVDVLYLNGNNIVDYQPLSQLTRLESLHLSEMIPPLTSLGQIPAIESLRNLWLARNEISVLLDTNNPWVTFHYLPSNPLYCSVQEEFLAAYPNAGIYDAENTCVADADSDNDGLIDAEEDRLGLDKLNPDSDADGISDGEDAYNLLISGEFPDFTLDVITPFATAVDGFLGIRSPSGCEVDAFFPEISENRSRYTWTATENTPSGRYWVGGGATRQIGSEGQIETADGEYELILDNPNGIGSSVEFTDWSVGPEGVVLSANGLINGAAARYDYPNGVFPEGASQATDKPIVVSLQIGPEPDGNSLGVEPSLISETDGLAILQSQSLLPEFYEDARISRVWICDGALNRTDIQGPDSDGDGALDIFDRFPEDPLRYRL